MYETHFFIASFRGFQLHGRKQANSQFNVVSLQFYRFCLLSIRELVRIFLAVKNSKFDLRDKDIRLSARILGSVSADTYLAMHSIHSIRAVSFK